MFRRALIASLTAAALLPFGGPAHASCLDDALARNLAAGYTESPKSDRWAWLFVTTYVEQTGPATVTFYGDALVGDMTSYGADDVPEWTQVVTANTVDTAADFADCVAG